MYYQVIHDLKNEIEDICGKPEKPRFTDKIIAAVKWVDGTVIDVVKSLNQD
jgi:citrate lyase subunit alpha/citrate CoA-transferase